jgi:tetratricopeptide (TPR) repeat protein
MRLCYNFRYFNLFLGVSAMRSRFFQLFLICLVIIPGIFFIDSARSCGSAEARTGGRKWAVVVGINDYMKEVTPLRCAINDAETFRKILTEKAGFADNDVILLTSGAKGNRLPDKSNIIRWVSYIKSNASSDDTVLFFFSGHGIDMNNESYLLTYEADPYSKDTLETSSLKESDLRKMLEEMPVGRILLFVDACRNDPRSGKGDVPNTMTAGQSKGLVIRSGFSPEVKTGGNFTYTFFSCKVGQRSYEWSEQRMGFFTYYLVKALSGDSGALDGHGDVTIGLLKKYLGREVSQAVKRERGQQLSQDPWVTGDASADADLWVLSHPGSAALAPPAGQEQKSRQRGPSSDKDKAEEHYMEGDDHYYKMLGFLELKYIETAKVELKKSYEAYTEAIRLDPGFSEAFSSRGVLLAEAGEYDAALKDCNKALEITPGSAQAHNNRAAVEYRMEDYDRAIEDCTKAIGLDPELITAYNMRGYGFMKKGDYEKALADFSCVLNIDPRRSVAYDYRGRVYLKKGMTDRAIEDFTKAVEYRPRYMPGYFNRSLACMEKGDYQKAVADCDRALALNPNHAPAYQLKAKACEKLGRKAEAAEAEKKFLDLSGGSSGNADLKSKEGSPKKPVDSGGTDSRLKELEEKLKRFEGK